MFLALCTLFNLPDRPRIFFIEEPETYLNPNRLRVLSTVFMHRFAAANSGKQVLMSSHSPYFIDWSEERPEELTLMNDREGWIEFQNLKGVKDLRFFLEEDAWGQDWVAKFFRADYADDPLPEYREETRETEEYYYTAWDRETDEHQVEYSADRTKRVAKRFPLPFLCVRQPTDGN